MTTAINLHETFQNLIKDMETSAHGSKSLQDLRAFLKDNFSKTSARKDFMLSRLFKESISWDVVKDHVWPSEQDRQNNNFLFLQGDIIRTQMVLHPGSSESTQNHDLWMILSPDCDCVRSEWIRVAPVFLVTATDKDSTDRFGLALKLHHKFFPIDKNFSDADAAAIGYYADLISPSYITAEFKAFATPVLSMSLEGWHILNSVIQDSTTRALNIEEAVKIRSFVKT